MNQDDPEGRDQLKELRCLVDPAEQQDLHDHADQADGAGGNQDGGPETDPGGADRLDQRVPDIGAQHVERAVGEVHDPGHPEDDRQPRSDQEHGCGAGQPRQQADNEIRHAPVLPALLLRPSYNPTSASGAGQAAPDAAAVQSALRSFRTSSSDGR